MVIYACEVFYYVSCIIAYFIFMQTDKRWYITVLQLSQYLSDNYMTEICQKCDIMKITK